MKKILTAVMALIITAGLVQAQDKSTTTTKAPATQTAAKCDMKNCCMMKAGKMVCMKDGKEMAMTEDMKLNNGSVVHADGTMVTKDGKKSKLKDGECIDMNGTVGKMAKPHAAATPDKAKPAQTAPAK